MKTVFSPLAEKQFKKLSKIAQIAIAGKIRNIESEIIPANIKFLSGYRGLYRIRIGDYRIVFKKYPNKVYFILIAHRKEIYKLLSRI
jgi:mRNA interferase RelE/StbE